MSYSRIRGNFPYGNPTKAHEPGVLTELGLPAMPPDPSLDRLIRRLDVSSLRLLEVVCNCGSISRAAHTEALTASAISKRLKELEQTLGRELVQRRHDGIRPTRAGRVVLQQWNEIKSRLGILGNGPDGIEGQSSEPRLVVVCDERVFDFFSLDMLIRSRTLGFASEMDVYPTQRDIASALLEAGGDFGVSQIDAPNASPLPWERSDHDALRLYFDPVAYIAVVRADHPLAASAAPVAADLLEFDLWPIGGAERLVPILERAAGRASRVHGAPRWLRMSNALSVLEEREVDAVVLAPVSLRETCQRYPDLRCLEPAEPWARLTIEVLIPKDGEGFERSVDVVRAIFA